MDPVESVNSMLETMGLPKMQGKPSQEEERKSSVERAAAVLLALDTPGGAAIKETVAKLMEGTMVPPETYVRTVNGQSSVDATQVALHAGYRQALKDISAFMEKCGKIVDEEAKRADRR